MAMNMGKEGNSEFQRQLKLTQLRVLFMPQTRLFIII